MDVGEAWTRWTVRVALGFYVLALAMRFGLSGGRFRSATGACSRLFWTLGCIAFLVHVVCAFHFYHGWSHAAAYEATARQTADVVGLDWGGGIFANYAFAIVWAADTAWWWASPATYLARSRFIEWIVQGFLGFIAFNATVVFGAGMIRWLGLAACTLLVSLSLLDQDFRGRVKSRPGASEGPSAK